VGAPEGSDRRPHLPLSASYSVEHGDLASAVFAARVLERGLPFVVSDNWRTQGTTFDLPGERALTTVMPWGRSEVVLTADAVASISLQVGHASVSVAADTEERAGELIEELRRQLPTPDPSGRQEVTVTFWTYGPHGPQPAWRTITVPQWSEIDRNYAGEARSELERLMRELRPASGGQLVLWHGESGTGKTFALRALAWEWRDWCDVHYVVDPDSFFGQHADYLMHVLLQTENEGGWTSYVGGGALGFSMRSSELVVGEGDEAEEERRPRDWRLLVLEDTGELLQPDAKAIIGQGLARFLNLVDGLIGQGLRVLVLVTTNEEIRKLHPAVARPGRCAANVSFTRLSAEESDSWLGERGVAPAGKAQTVAELYSRLAGGDGAAPSEPFAPVDDE